MERLLPRLILAASLVMPAGPGWTQALPAPGADAPRFADLNPMDLLSSLGEEAGRDRGQERDIETLAARLATPEASFAFVRDRIALEAYPGVMRGALGTLLAGAGNAADRALLLSALLRAQGAMTRFARGEIPEAAAQRLLDRAATAPWRIPEPRSMLWEAVKRRAAQDEASLRAAALPALRQTIDPTRLRAVALADLRQHVWVEVLIGEVWRVMDPSLADAVPGQAMADAAEYHDAPPDDWLQRVTFRIVAEYAEQGRLRRETALELSLPAMTASRSRLALFFQPLESGAGGVLGRASPQSRGTSPARGPRHGRRGRSPNARPRDAD